MAAALLYAERSIRSTITHRVRVLTLRLRGDDRLTRIADLRGQVVLVNFWATWCPPCRAEMPDLNRLSSVYRGRGVAVLAISDEPPERIGLFEKKVVPLTMQVGTFASDKPQGMIAKVTYSGRPTTVIIDRDGRVRQIFIGIQSYDKLKAAIERVL